MPIDISIQEERIKSIIDQVKPKIIVGDLKNCNKNVSKSEIYDIMENENYKELKNNKDIDLLENEILDSLAFIELIETMNNEFNVEIQPTEVTPETWRSVKNIAEYTDRLKN